MQVSDDFKASCNCSLYNCIVAVVHNFQSPFMHILPCCNFTKRHYFLNFKPVCTEFIFIHIDFLIIRDFYNCQICSVIKVITYIFYKAEIQACFTASSYSQRVYVNIHPHLILESPHAQIFWKNFAQSIPLQFFSFYNCSLFNCYFI